MALCLRMGTAPVPLGASAQDTLLRSFTPHSALLKCSQMRLRALGARDTLQCDLSRDLRGSRRSSAGMRDEAEREAQFLARRKDVERPCNPRLSPPMSPIWQQVLHNTKHSKAQLMTAQHADKSYFRATSLERACGGQMKFLEKQGNHSNIEPPTKIREDCARFLKRIVQVSIITAINCAGNCISFHLLICRGRDAVLSCNEAPGGHVDAQLLLSRMRKTITYHSTEMRALASSQAHLCWTRAYVVRSMPTSSP